uniref:Core shell protein Gag P30 domain-containing protein n=1 Tax=Corvus moneduloides TaxID=1196302 RepID=A0A8U7N7Y5_CORMO
MPPPPDFSRGRESADWPLPPDRPRGREEAGMPPPPDFSRGGEGADWPPPSDQSRGRDREGEGEGTGWPPFPEYPEHRSEGRNGHGQLLRHSPIQRTASFRARDRRSHSLSPPCSMGSVKAEGRRDGPDPGGSCRARDERSCLQPLPPYSSTAAKSEAVPDQHSPGTSFKSNEPISIKSKWDDFDTNGEGGRRRGRIAREAMRAVSPVTKHTRPKTDKGGEEELVLEAPLRQDVGNQGVIYIKAPFSLRELQQWKNSIGKYRDNPERVAMCVEMAVKSQNPDWGDLNVMLYELLNKTEREMVNKAAISAIETQIATGSLQGSVNDIYPLVNPSWDPNVPEQMEKLKQYQKWVVVGLKCAVPKAVNWARLYEIKQNPNETPTEFLNRLKEAAQKYTTLDPASPEQQIHLAYLFIGQSANDIKKKLQKIDGPPDISKLLTVAWKVYQNRDLVDKEKCNKPHYKKKYDKEKSSDTSKMGPPFPLSEDQCAIFKKRGHWKNECPS